MQIDQLDRDKVDDRNDDVVPGPEMMLDGSTSDLGPLSDGGRGGARVAKLADTLYGRGEKRVSGRRTTLPLCSSCLPNGCFPHILPPHLVYEFLSFMSQGQILQIKP